MEMQAQTISRPSSVLQSPSKLLPAESVTLQYNRLAVRRLTVKSIAERSPKCNVGFDTHRSRKLYQDVKGSTIVSLFLCSFSSLFNSTA